MTTPATLARPTDDRSIQPRIRDDSAIFCNAPANTRARYARTIRAAEAGNYRAAVKLSCIDCMGYQPAEAKRCPVRRCPLWAASSKIFKRDAKEKP